MENRMKNAGKTAVSLCFSEKTKKISGNFQKVLDFFEILWYY